MAIRLHLFGASGSGTTTLGSALAKRLDIPFLDTDSYYWQPTDPPFTKKRDPAERVAMIEREIAECDSWVLSGSLCSWGEPLLHHFTLAIFLSLPHAQRMERLLDRERARYGDSIQPGGDMHDAHREFMDWASRYDTGKAPLRSFDLHERWMHRLTCPIMRLDSRQPVEALCDAVMMHPTFRQSPR